MPQFYVFPIVALNISTGDGAPHRNFTSPPSLWPGRELREYHCPSERIVAGIPYQWSAEQAVDRSSFRSLGGSLPMLPGQGM